MPHATSDPSAASAPLPETKMNQHLTESILTLQQTIRNIKEDVEKGIAPSLLLPADPVSPIFPHKHRQIPTPYRPKTSTPACSS
jgi:hypothetical protein